MPTVAQGILGGVAAVVILIYVRHTCATVSVPRSGGPYLTTERVDTFKSIWSIGLALFGMVTMTDATVKGQNLWPFGGGAAFQIPFLVGNILLLGTLEGIQISLVALKNHNSEVFKHTHPRAYKTNKLAQQGKNLERFLMGRQVFVVLTVFFGSYITTQSEDFVHLFSWNLNEVVRTVFFQTGLMGVLVVAIFGQLMPQVVASAYPINFMQSIPFVYPTLVGCLFFEDLGIMYHCYTVAEIFMRISGLKKENDPKEIALKKRGFSVIFGMNTKAKVRAASAAAAAAAATQGTAASELPLALVDVLDSIEKDADPDDEIIRQANRRYPNLFNNFPRMIGGKAYASPQQVAQTLDDMGYCGPTPSYLQPVGSPDHVPPHIYVIKLLAEQNELLAKVEDKEELYLRAAEISEVRQDLKDVALMNAMSKIE